MGCLSGSKREGIEEYNTHLFAAGKDRATMASSHLLRIAGIVYCLASLQTSWILVVKLKEHTSGIGMNLQQAAYGYKQVLEHSFVLSLCLFHTFDFFCVIDLESFCKLDVIELVLLICIGAYKKAVDLFESV